MRHNIIHWFLNTLVAAGMTLCAVSCGDDGSWSNLDPGTGQHPDAEKPTEVTLRLKVSVLGDTPQTRAYPGVPDDGSFEDPATEYERLHTLRVIIVDSLGKVEHNRMVNLDKDGNVINDNLEFRISVPWIKEENGKEHFGVANKKIWLFGNEKAANPAVCDAMVSVKLTETGAALTQDQMDAYKNNGNMALDLLSVGTTFCGAFDKVHGWATVEAQPQTALQSAVLTREEGKPFIDNSGTEKQYVPMNEFFDISITPDDLKKSEGGTILRVTKDLFVTRSLVKFTFSAQFAETNLNNERMRISKITVTDIAKNGYYIPNATYYDPGKYTKSNNENGGRWITQFAVPQNVVKSSYTFIPPAGENDSFLVLKEEPAKGKRNVYTAYKYFPETKLSGDNRYYVSLKAEVYNDETNSWDELSYGPVPLRGLASNPVDLLDIPRNTHVYVNFLFNDYGVNAVVDLVPYTGVWLEPEFGIPTTE